MASASYFAGDSASNVPKERASTRIRTFLAKTMPLRGCSFGDDPWFWEGRALIEGLATAYDAEIHYEWDEAECATVLRYLDVIQPIEGSCFCNDPSEVNATCGFHNVLDFAADELDRLAARSARWQHKAAAHG